MDLQQFHEMEARCTQEDMPRCTAACPLHVDVRGMLAAVRKGDFSKGYIIFSQMVPFPGIISHTCDHPCQNSCIRAEIDDGIVVNALERACSTFNAKPLPKRPLIQQKDKKIAVVGAGVSGLTAAYYLAGKGYRVNVFDAGNALGGRLNALSEAVLPRRIMADDLATLTYLRVQTTLGVVAGNNADAHISFDALLEQYDAVYLGLGRTDVGGLKLGLDLDDGGTIRVDPETLGTSNPKVFSGGSHRQSSANISLIDSVCDGKSAMISSDRFLQNASLTANRANEGPQSTRLFTCTDGVDPQPVTRAAEPGQGYIGYTGDEAVTEAERCLDCQCLECVNLCEYMRHYKTAPRLLARQIFKNMSGVGGHRSNQQMNSCSLCRQCEAVCKDGFSLADVCRAAREALVREGKMPPSAFDFALQDMKYSGSDAFSLTRHEPERSESAYVFYPGCQLSGAAPWQVIEIYGYLRGKISDGVGLMLGCCGVQADWAGEKDKFLESLAAVRARWTELGKPVMIVACPTCYMVFKQHLPEINVEFLSSIMENLGLPKSPSAVPRTVAIHDSCTTRFEREIQDSVRRILSTLGHTVEELKTGRELTECCGFGGLMQISNRHLAHQVVDRRIGESDSDYLVYCSMCRENFANRGKTTYHLLDMLFGDEAGSMTARPAVGYSQRHDNRARLKARMLREVWGEEDQQNGAPSALHISSEVRSVMEDSLILDADVRAVIEYAERTGNKLQNRSSGHLIASFRPAHVTYWVEYAPAESGFTIYDAYCHRLEIVERLPAASVCGRAASPE